MPLIFLRTVREHFQEKWRPVFRPKMRQPKKAHSVSTETECALDWRTIRPNQARRRKLLLMFEHYTLDAARRELRRGGALVSLEPQVFDLLLYLVENRDRVVSKDDLLGAVWNGRIVSESTLTSRINAARRAVGDSGKAQRLIRTMLRKGIRFVGAVRAEQAGTESAPADLAVEPAGSGEPGTTKRAIAVAPAVGERKHATALAAVISPIRIWAGRRRGARGGAAGSRGRRGRHHRPQRRAGAASVGRGRAGAVRRGGRPGGSRDPRLPCGARNSFPRRAGFCRPRAPRDRARFGRGGAACRDGRPRSPDKACSACACSGRNAWPHRARSPTSPRPRRPMRSPRTVSPLPSCPSCRSTPRRRRCRCSGLRAWASAGSSRAIGSGNSSDARRRWRR